MFNKKYPKYVRSADGFVGKFSYLDFDNFPVYHFPGGYRVADEYEIENGFDFL